MYMCFITYNFEIIIKAKKVMYNKERRICIILLRNNCWPYSYAIIQIVNLINELILLVLLLVRNIYNASKHLQHEQ